MNATVLQRDVFMPRQPRGLGLGLVLALIAHVLLVIALAFGVNWRSHEPQGVEAELWSATPQAAAPRAVEPEPQPTPPQPKPPQPAARRPEPTPAPAPAPEPKPAPVQQPLPDPQIAIEKAKREQAKKDQLREEQEEREQAKEQAKKDQAKRDKAEQLKKEKDQAKREEAERDKAEQDRKKQLADKEKEKERADAAKLAAAREANLKRMMGQAGATGGPTATGTAARSSGPSPGYAGRIAALVKRNIAYRNDSGGNPVATVEVRVATDGTIIGMKLTKSSGDKLFDDAVLRAIDKTGIFPRDTNGTIPSPMELNFRAND